MNMFGNSVELIALTEDELKRADKIASSIGVKCIYVAPELVQVAGVARSLSGGIYKIIVMVDSPKGSKRGMEKINGSNTDFFLVDGYDITLTPGMSATSIESEVRTLSTFIKQMVNTSVELCYTINNSMRNDGEVIALAKSFYKMPPTKIKTESQTRVQPTKANLDVHKNTIKLMREHCTIPMSICGNVTYDIYNELQGAHKVAISPDQYERIKSDEIEERNKKSELAKEDN
jgi:hypothetical protein